MHTHTYMDGCMHTYMHTYNYAYMHTYNYIYKSILTYLHAYICKHTYICLHRGFVLVHGVLSGGFVYVFFVRGGFCPFLLLSENRKLNIAFNVRFHMNHMHDKQK